VLRCGGLGDMSARGVSCELFFVFAFVIFDSARGSRDSVVGTANRHWSS